MDGESEGTPVNFLNKGSFWYTGFQYTLLSVDYSSTNDIDEVQCKMEGERHLFNIESRKRRSYYKQCNQTFLVCGIFL